jgi:hypothetical protein
MIGSCFGAGTLFLLFLLLFWTLLRNFCGSGKLTVEEFECFSGRGADRRRNLWFGLGYCCLGLLKNLWILIARYLGGLLLDFLG